VRVNNNNNTNIRNQFSPFLGLGTTPPGASYDFVRVVCGVCGDLYGTWSDEGLHSKQH